MSVLGMSLNLPEDIESEAEDIRTGVDELFVLRDTMLGHAGDADASLQNAADEFVGTLSWDISEASQQDLDSWQNLAELLTGTGLALGFFADAVDDHREAREGCESRWEEYKIFAQARIDDDEGGLNFNGMRQKDAEIEHLITIRSTARSRASRAVLGGWCASVFVCGGDRSRRENGSQRAGWLGWPRRTPQENHTWFR